jgi:hypothetical protein
MISLGGEVGLMRVMGDGYPSAGYFLGQPETLALILGN